MGACVKREKNAYFNEMVREELRAELLKKYIGKRKVTKTAVAKQEVKVEQVPVTETARPKKVRGKKETPPLVLTPKNAPAPEAQPPLLSPTPPPPDDESEVTTTTLFIESRPAQQESSALPESDVFSPFESAPSEAAIHAITEENVMSSEESTPRGEVELARPSQTKSEDGIERVSGDPEAAFVFLRSHYLRNPAPLLSDEELELNFQGRLTIEKETETRNSFVRQEKLVS